MDLSSTVFAFIPIVGGYRFARKWNLSRFSVVREDGHKLYFRSAFYGLILFIFVYGLYFLSVQTSLFFACLLKNSFGSLVFDPTVIWPSQREFQTVAVLSAFSGDLLALAINKYGPRFNAYVSWTSNMFLVWLEGDPLEDLLYNASREQMPIAFSMDNNLVFVGYWITSSAPNEKLKWIKILPLASGYRNKQGSIQLRTQYKDMYKAIDDQDENLNHLKIEHFYKAIDLERLVAANLFDVKAFVKFGNLRNKPKARKTSKKK